jgi:hypothetical protein
LLPHEAAFGGPRPSSVKRRRRPTGRRARVPFASHRHDVIVEALALARTLANADPLSGLLARELQPAGRALRDYVAETVRNYYHPAGTCAIGDVTDATGHVLGIDGLVIADASLMPTLPRSNTHLTTLAIADLIAGTSFEARSPPNGSASRVGFLMLLTRSSRRGIRPFSFNDGVGSVAAAQRRGGLRRARPLTSDLRVMLCTPRRPAVLAARDHKARAERCE